MTKSMHASLAAIGQQLHEDHAPNSAESLPPELRKIVAQLVAIEFGKRGSSAPSVELLHSIVAQRLPRS